MDAKSADELSRHSCTIGKRTTINRLGGFLDCASGAQLTLFVLQGCFPGLAGCLTRLVGRALPNAAAMHSLHSHTIRSVQDNGIKWPSRTRTRTRLHSCLRISPKYTIPTHMNLVHVSVGSTYICFCFFSCFLLLDTGFHGRDWSQAAYTNVSAISTACHLGRPFARLGNKLGHQLQR